MLKLSPAILIAVGVVAIAIHAAPIDNLKLKFRISARDLADKDDLGSSDPYVEIFYTEENNKNEVKLGKTSVVLDTLNPDWGETFEFDFVRSKRQRFVLRVWDEDNISDDNLGHAYVEVMDYVDKQQHLTVNLNKKGYLILETVSSHEIPTTSTQKYTSAPPKTPAPVIPPSYPSDKASYSDIAKGVTSHASSLKTTLPPTHPIDIAKPFKLKFKLSAHNLQNKDTVGSSDPYVEISFSEGSSGKTTKFATTTVIDDDLNPIWPEVFEFDYDPKKSQKLYFDVKDSDYGDSDGLGKAEIFVSEYLQKGQKATLNLSKQQGTITIEAATTHDAHSHHQTTLHPNKNAGTTTKGTTTTTTTTTTPSPLIKLRFKLAAYGLDDQDILGTSDPYVKFYITEGNGKEVFIKNTQKFVDLENVEWPDVFEYTYDPKKAPVKFRFLVLDEDDNLRDDELGNATIDVKDYIKSGENLTVSLKKGTLTISKA